MLLEAIDGFTRPTIGKFRSPVGFFIISFIIYIDLVIVESNIRAALDRRIALVLSLVVQVPHLGVREIMNVSVAVGGLAAGHVVVGKCGEGQSVTGVLGDVLGVLEAQRAVVGSDVV